jgi:hypothetical protein
MVVEYGVVGGMMIGKRKMKVLRENLHQCQFVHHILHDLTWDQTRATMVGNQ